MSTLTKVLIVLLTLSSLFLCGIIVTYVANAEDYREQNADLKRSLSAARQTAKTADDERRKFRDESEQEQTRLNNQIAALQTDIIKLRNDLTTVERDKAKLIQDLANSESTEQALAQTIQQQTQLFNDAQADLKEVTGQRDRLDKQLKDMTGTLNEKLAVMATLEADVRRLEEEKAKVQSEYDKFLRQFGKEAVAPEPVTPKPDQAKPVAPVAKKMELKGLVTVVDPKNALAQISIGAAAGVKKDMKFYVTRGDEFICEIWIHHVDAERAIGDLKLVQKQPRVGDGVATNL